MAKKLLACPLYRIYHIDVDGVFIKAELLDALDDLDAVVRARYKIERSASELWDRDRLIARLGPEELT